MPVTLLQSMRTPRLLQIDSSRSATSLALSEHGKTLLPRSVFSSSPFSRKNCITAVGGKAVSELYRKRPSPGIWASTSLTSQSFVRLQRPFPVMRSLRPAFLFFSAKITDAPCSAAVRAAIRPDAPAPITTTSAVILSALSSGSRFPLLSACAPHRSEAGPAAAVLRQSAPGAVPAGQPSRTYGGFPGCGLPLP